MRGLVPSGGGLMEEETDEGLRMVGQNGEQQRAQKSINRKVEETPEPKRRRCAESPAEPRSAQSSADASPGLAVVVADPAPAGAEASLAAPAQEEAIVALEGPAAVRAPREVAQQLALRLPGIVGEHAPPGCTFRVYYHHSPNPIWEGKLPKGKNHNGFKSCTRSFAPHLRSEEQARMQVLDFLWSAAHAGVLDD